MYLDAPIGSSIYRYGLWIAFVGLVGVLAVASNLSLWHYGAGIVVLTVLIYSELTKPTLKHIVSADDQGEWQFLVATHSNDELWRGQPLKLKDFGFCVVIIAQIELPMPTQAKWVIYQDMLTADDYRKLKVLARF